MSQMGLTPQRYLSQASDTTPRWVLTPLPLIWVQFQILRKPNKASIFNMKTQYFRLEAANIRVNMHSPEGWKNALVVNLIQLTRFARLHRCPGKKNKVINMRMTGGPLNIRPAEMPLISTWRITQGPVTCWRMTLCCAYISCRDSWNGLTRERVSRDWRRCLQRALEWREDFWLTQDTAS